MKKILLIALLTSILSSCTATKGVLVSEKKEGWFNGVRNGDYVFLPNPLSMFNPFLDRGFFYCKANEIADTALANPICYQVRYSSYSSEKEEYDEQKARELANEKYKEEKRK